MASNSVDRFGPSPGAGRSAMLRRGGRARPEMRSCSSREVGIGVRSATGRPRSVMVTVAPAAASATTAEAFCLRARMPTSSMCFIVAPEDLGLPLNRPACSRWDAPQRIGESVKQPGLTSRFPRKRQRSSPGCSLGRRSACWPLSTRRWDGLRRRNQCPTARPWERAGLRILRRGQASTTGDEGLLEPRRWYRRQQRDLPPLGAVAWPQSPPPLGLASTAVTKPLPSHAVVDRACPRRRQEQLRGSADRSPSRLRGSADRRGLPRVAELRPHCAPIGSANDAQWPSVTRHDG